MSANNTDMSKIKQVMRMMLQRNGGKHPSNREIGRTVGLYKGTVNDYVRRIESDPLPIGELLELEDPVLERRLCPGNAAYSDERLDYLLERMSHYHMEMQRPHMTLQLLYEEYREQAPRPYSYSQFCFHYSQHCKASTPPTMVLTEQREGGREMMVDFAGDKLHIVDIDTGEKRLVELFVSTLPASDYPFAMAVGSQSIEDFILGCRSALEDYGGVPLTITTDNLKAAVIKSDRYQPEVNKVFEDFCNHYGMVHTPARAYKPRDKALVENHVRILYNRIYAALRDRVFFSLDELNEAIADLLQRHRQKRMRQYDVTRQERFLAIDKPALRQLPPLPFEIKCYAEYTVQLNSYIQLGQDKRYYSMPCHLIGKKVKVIYTPTVLTAYYSGEPVATHYRTGTERYVTQPDHLPSYHGDYQKRSPERYTASAYSRSQSLGQVMERMFSSNPLAPPETFYKSADGLLHLAKVTHRDLMEEACKAALTYGQCSYAFVKRVVSTKAEGLKPRQDEETPAPSHSNIRGKEYYTEKFY